jgi:hypothetical protein
MIKLRCISYGEVRNEYKVLVWKLPGKLQPERLKNR